MWQAYQGGLVIFSMLICRTLQVEPAGQSSGSRPSSATRPSSAKTETASKASVKADAAAVQSKWTAYTAVGVMYIGTLPFSVLIH